MGDLFIFAVTCAGAALVGRLLAVRIEEGFRLLRASESRYHGIFENVQDVTTRSTLGAFCSNSVPRAPACSVCHAKK